MTASKFVPVTVKLVPATPIDGLRLVIVGAPPLVCTVKGMLLLFVPFALTAT